MSAIGGYFGLELARGEEYHPDAIKLNSGRNALEYILTGKKYRKLFLPYYTCDVLLEPVKKLNIAFEFYSITKDFEINLDLTSLKKDEALLYTNYFGLKDDYVLSLVNKNFNLILDNAQAFYAMPFQNADTFYSPRKFFGVPDGAYLYTDIESDTIYDKATSYQRFEHLLRRLDNNAEDGYPYFVENDTSLNNLPVLHMSALTHSLLRSIDYKTIAINRRDNYNYLQQHLGSINELAFTLNDSQVPMVYPFYTADATLRKRLTEHKIYTATYWPNVMEWATESSIDYIYAKSIVHLPIDQRLDTNDLDKLIKHIKS